MVIILILILIIIVIIIIIAPAWMYITQVLFKRGLILLEFFCCNGWGLAADCSFKDSFWPANFPLLCGMNMYPTVKYDFIL